MSDPTLSCHPGTQPATWAWISGWGIQPQRFEAAAKRALPEATHRVFAPEPGAVDAALNCGTTHLGGYSLGSLLLLCALDRIDFSGRLCCLAPIPAFCHEAGLGGQTPQAILTSLQAKVERKPEAALKLFYRLSGLIGEPTDGLPYAAASLQWGLEMLATLRAPSDAFPRVHAVIGRADTLMDAGSLQGSFPHHTIIDRGHAYHDLLAALTEIQ
jgi:hypothetical protein